MPEIDRNKVVKLNVKYQPPASLNRRKSRRFKKWLLRQESLTLPAVAMFVMVAFQMLVTVGVWELWKSELPLKIPMTLMSVPAVFLAYMGVMRAMGIRLNACMNALWYTMLTISCIGASCLWLAIIILLIKPT